jgi:quercetin dioxygenase-like cupin family protein
VRVPVTTVTPFGEHLTLAVVEVEPGAELPEHSHVNEQFGMVIEGSVVFRVGEESRIVRPGGIWRIPSNMPHTITGGDRGAVVVDIFSPPRDDWAAREMLDPRPTQWPQPPRSDDDYQATDLAPGRVMLLCLSSG